MKKINKKLISHNEFGFSMIEAMIGIALIAITAVTITQFSTLKKSQESNNLSMSCSGIAKSSIDTIKDISMSSNMSSFFWGDSAAASDYYSNYNLDSLTGKVNNIIDAWAGTGTGGAPTNTPYLNPTGGGNFVSNTHLLKESSIRALTTIYNELGTGVCTNWTEYAPITSQLMSSDLIKKEGVNSANVRIRIIPYDIITKVPIANCGALPSPLYIKPSSDPNYTIGGINISNWANVRDDLGVRLQVQVNYNEGDQAYSCDTSHDFQYPKDIDRPEISFFEVAGLDYGGAQNPNAFSCTTPYNQAATVTIHLGVDQNQFEEGTSFLCKDDSNFINYHQGLTMPNTAAPVPAAGGNYACINPGVDPNGTVYRYGVPLNGNAEVGPSPFTTTGPVPNQNEWRGCHQVTLCGQSLTGYEINSQAGTVDRSGNQTARTLIKMTFNLPQKAVNDLEFCQINMTAAAVDSSGNLSATTPLAIPVSGPGGAFIRGSVTNGTRNKTSVRADVLADGTFTGGTSTFEFSEYFEPSTSIGTAPAHCGTNTTLCTSPPATTPTNNQWHITWRNRFPNGYYTCRATCCEDFSSTPSTGTFSDICHPWRN